MPVALAAVVVERSATGIVQNLSVDALRLFCRYSQRTLIPTQIARGAAGATAFSCGRLLGSGMNVPFGLNELVVRNPAVAYCLSNRLMRRAKIWPRFLTSYELCRLTTVYPGIHPVPEIYAPPPFVPPASLALLS